MALLKILHYPDPRLRKKAQQVAEVDSKLRATFEDMLETMYAAPGIGLAATQVGIAKRFMVIDVSEEKNQPRVFVNPEIVSRSGECVSEEGCLSVPGYFDEVKRADRITVKALDQDGQPFELEASDLLAVCIQHEIDHLNGRLFIDYLSDLKRTRIRKQMEKAQRDPDRRTTHQATRPPI